MLELSGVLHAHTEHSIKESSMRIREYIEKAGSMGVNKLAITDTGSMTGIFEFMNYCRSHGIEPIIGIDAYIGTNEKGRFHSLVLLAKDYKGYQNLCHMLTDGYKYIYTDETKIDKPVIPYSSLAKYGSEGNIIALTSGLRGIPASILFSDRELSEKIDELNNKLSKVSNPNDIGYIMNVDKINILESELKDLKERKEELKKIATESFKKPLSALKSLKDTDPELYYRKKIELDKRMKESGDAKNELEGIDHSVKNINQLLKTIKRKTSQMEKGHKEYYVLKEELDELKKQIKSEEEKSKEFSSFFDYMKNIFKENLYIEIGYHNEPEEEELINKLIYLSEEKNIAIVASNEPYMADKEDIETRQIMLSLQRNRWEKLKKSDTEYYIKTDDEIRKSLKGIIDEKHIEEAIRNISVINSKCHLEIPETKHYPRYIENGHAVEDSASLLKEKAFQGIAKRGFTKDTFTYDYINRLNNELDVIISMGFADYLLIVQDFITYGKRLCRENNEYGLGYGVGPGRGSAAGSLVCYLLGITNIDPLPYNLKFERFLNKERVSMPDIDTDFSAEIRYKCAEYVSEKYGRDSVAFIRTSMTQKARAAIRNVTRVISDRDFHDTKVLMSLGDRIANTIPANQVNAKLKDYEKEILALNDDKYKDYIEKIYRSALKVEGLMTGLGVHAAGVIIGDGNPLSDYVPLLYNNEMNVWAVECDMVEAEESAGLLKMDFLGLKNLDVMSETIRRIKKYTGEEIDLDNIPYEKEVFDEIFSKGMTSSVFQFESAGMKEMLKKFKPSSFEDIVLLVAAYRPGPLEFIPKIIDSKHGNSSPYYCVPELESILASTYGYPIYQEQLMDIFAICAGFSQGEADIVRRNMSKKKVEKFLEAKPRFIDGLIRHGAKTEDAEELWESLVSFSAYAFNKSHAAAYAKISYQTAWLKYHYKEYYMCSVLNNSDVKKYAGLLYECRELGINILLPDINRSGMNFENTPDGILFGMGKIKTVKNQVGYIIDERKQNGAFISYKEFIRRTGCSKKLTEALVNAGCFDSMRPDMRKSLILSYDSINKILTDIKKRKDKISAEENKMTAENMTDYKKKKARDTIKRYKEEIEELETEYMNFHPTVDIPEDDNKLNLEYSMLNAYISSHPLDPYKDIYRKESIRLISEFDKSEGTYVGMIKNLKKVNRKSDGAGMAFFDFEDISGTIPVCCFTREYAEYSNMIVEGTVVEISAKGIDEINSDDEMTEKLILRKMNRVKIEKSPIFFSIRSIRDELALYNICKDYEDENGHPVMVHHQNTGEIFRRNMSVKKDVMQILQGNTYVKILFDYKKLDYTSKSPY